MYQLAGSRLRQLVHIVHLFLLAKDLAAKLGLVATLAGLAAVAGTYPHGCRLDLAARPFSAPQYVCHTMRGTVLLPSDDFETRFAVALLAFAMASAGCFALLWIVRHAARALLRV